ncbi:MAG TPA: pyridoxamine 5'-phosphate oxidase family protein [Streptosporangiaceae bacterium]
MGEQGPGEGWQELTKSECFDLLAREPLGRIAILDDLGPATFPVNFIFDNHMVAFRTDEGSKLDAACRGSRVAFEIDGFDAATRTGWSVLIRGEATEVTDPAELRRLGEILPAPWAPGVKAHVVRVLPAVVTGRRIVARGHWPDLWARSSRRTRSRRASTGSSANGSTGALTCFERSSGGQASEPARRRSAPSSSSRSSTPAAVRWRVMRPSALPLVTRGSRSS